MLGETIAQEIKDIEEEKICNCPECLIKSALRNALIYRETLQCSCPVCTTTVKQLHNYIQSMATSFNLACEQQKEIDEIKCKLVIVPDEYEHMNGVILARERNIAAAITISTTIKNLIVDYKELSNNAHYAYEKIEHGTINDLAKTAAEAIAYITNPPTTNPHEIN